MFVIVSINRHGDPDIYGPYETEDAAEADMKRHWNALWENACEDGGEVMVRPLSVPIALARL